MTQGEVSGSMVGWEVEHDSGASPGSATVSDVRSGELSAQQETVRQRVARAVAQMLWPTRASRSGNERGVSLQQRPPTRSFRV
jgi:hypothetical protein